jgi:two-component system, cell cycle sensor histidine kinase and response regulator CckA
MKRGPSFDDIFAVMAAASVGDLTARVPEPDDAQLDDPPTRFALALNILLDDLAFRAGEAQRELAERKRMTERLGLLVEAAQEFAATTHDYERLLEVIARRLGQVVGDLCGIRILSEDGQWLEPTGAVYHRDPEMLALAKQGAVADRQRLGQGISGRVAASGQPLLASAPTAAEFAAGAEPPYRSFLERLGITTSIAVPLKCRGKVLGVANLIRGSPGRPYGEDDLAFVGTVADHAALAIANALSYAAERASHATAVRANDALRESEEAHRLLFEASPLPLFVYDVETFAPLAVNEAALQLYGYRHDAFMGLNVTALAVATPEEVRATLDTWGGAPATGISRYRRRDGAELVAEYSTRALSFAGRRARITVLKDITTQRQGEEALRRTEEQLRQSQKMEAVGRLAGGVAHDFNNVLSVILSYADLLLMDLNPDEPMRDEVEEIAKAARRAAELTRQLLMFSRQQVLAPRVLDLNDVLTNMDKMLQRILGADVDLVSRPTPSLGRILVDPNTIEQVIMNLVVNARDAMPTGGKLTMETANVVLDESYARDHLGVKSGPHVMLAVTDTGIGMDRVTLSRIFEPFFTTKAAGKGTGLGLSTVFGIVQQSGGSVWVYSELGRGTTFKVYFPHVDRAVDVVRPAVPPTTLRGSETILLVEDDDQVRTVARGILARCGYHLIEARNAGEALLHSESHPGRIHLLLSDVVMPQMSGPELAKRLARARPDMRVLCMSGYTDDSIVRHGVLEARVAFLQKPITPESLTAKVREVLDATAGV